LPLLICLEYQRLKVGYSGCRKARKQIIIVGQETHVCILQTALELMQQGYQVHIVAPKPFGYCSVIMIGTLSKLAAVIKRELFSNISSAKKRMSASYKQH
jgi:hypothetical protein